MLYEEIKVILPRESLLPIDSSNVILKMPKTEIKDIIRLYIYVAGILKWLWDDRLLTAAVKKDDEGNSIKTAYQAKDVDYIILSQWANLSNKKILAYTIRKIAKILQEYLESCLIKRNPQLDFFRQFIDGNYLWLKYVFNISMYNESLILIYKDSEGNDIEVDNQSVLHVMNKEWLEEMALHNELPERVTYLLERLKLWSFPKWKKFLLNALKEQFKGNDVLEDGKYMSELEFSVTEIDNAEMVKTNKQKNEWDSK